MLLKFLFHEILHLLVQRGLLRIESEGTDLSESDPEMVESRSLRSATISVGSVSTLFSVTVDDGADFFLNGL